MTSMFFWWRYDFYDQTSVLVFRKLLIAPDRKKDWTPVFNERVTYHIILYQTCEYMIKLIYQTLKHIKL